MTFPTLYHKSKNNELRQWRTWSEGSTVFTEYGMVGGALQVSSKVCIPKNIGKTNATTPEEQASQEVQALHTFKLERKYSLTKEEAGVQLLLPMLAHKYEPKKHKNVNSGVYMSQPKLDGVRCLALWEGNEVKLYSRSGKLYNVEHIAKELKNHLGKDDTIDGELYIHGVPLQTLISWVKKPSENSKLIEYHVYDMPVVNGQDDLSFQDRHTPFDYGDDSKIKCVDTQLVTENNTMESLQAKWLSEGYEGLMLRGVDSKYLWGYRSSELLKVKNFQDSEFVVVDVIEGVGKMVGKAIIVCQNDTNSLTFKAVPKMTMEQREEIFINKVDYIGTSVTVRFFDRTEDDIPRFPTAVAFRNDLN